jgi:hypothetical protein
MPEGVFQRALETAPSKPTTLRASPTRELGMSLCGGQEVTTPPGFRSHHESLTTRGLVEHIAPTKERHAPVVSDGVRLDYAIGCITFPDHRPTTSRGSVRGAPQDFGPFRPSNSPSSAGWTGPHDRAASRARAEASAPAPWIRRMPGQAQAATECSGTASDEVTDPVRRHQAVRAHPSHSPCPATRPDERASSIIGECCWKPPSARIT